MTITALVALLIAALIPLLSLALIYRLDLFKTGAFQFVLIAFAWGAVAEIIAAQVNPFMMNSGWIDYYDMVRYSAPVLEEILKALVLLWLVRRKNFTYFVDGAIYGFAAGIGFAILENFEYVLGSPGTELLQAVSRVISTNLIHATGSAIIGIAFGLARFERGGRRVATLALGVLIAIGLHVGYNNLVTRIGGYTVLLYAASAGIGGAAFIGWAIKRGLKEELAWIKETLGQDSQISRHETAAIADIKDKRYLTRLAERFGPQTGALMQDLVLLQAQLGIRRKTAVTLTDPAQREASAAEAVRIEEQMKALRSQIGMYPMMYLRSTYLDESVQAFAQLDANIESQKQKRAPGAPSLWQTLDGRAAAPRPAPPEKPREDT